VTDSRAPGEPKDTEGSALFQIYQAFASAEETAAMRQAYAAGIAWSAAKEQLFERIDRELAPMRARYEALMQEPTRIDRILQAGADKARRLASPFMAELRHAVGLRGLEGLGATAAAPKAAKASLPQFKQYRERDGKFYFKLTDAQGRLLLQSRGFDAPREAGQLIAALTQQGSAVLAERQAQFEPLADAGPAELDQALAQLREAAQDKH
jgi:tryptophanyl-tRNA synthetase